MNKKTKIKGIISLILSICMVIGMMSAEVVKIDAEIGRHTLQNPTRDSNGNTIWDCVWFGAYPQSEVTSGDIYNKLKNATGWDENNDIVIDGNKYRRLKGEDATYYNTKRVLNYYDWIEDYSTYHYFKYEAIKWRVLNVSSVVFICYVSR